jgi:hypothetical protein
MKELRESESLGLRGVAIIAAAIGAVVVRAFAIGALAIRRWATSRVAVGGAKFEPLEIQDLTAARLGAAEVAVSESLRLAVSTCEQPG